MKKQNEFNDFLALAIKTTETAGNIVMSDFENASGFTQLGAPSDWDLTTDGENSTFRLKLANNKIPTSVTIHQLSATVSGHTGTNSTEFTISPGETKDTSVLIRNFAPATGSSYSVNVQILYDTGGYNHTETGTLTGLVSSAG